MLLFNPGYNFTGLVTRSAITWGLLFWFHSFYAQTYFGFGFFELYEIEISEPFCGCSSTLIANTEFSSGVTFCEDQMLYSQHHGVMTIVDTQTGMVDTIFNGVDSIQLPEGFGCLGNGLFYFLGNGPDPPLYLYDSNAGTITNLGMPGYAPIGEIAILNGVMYYSTLTGIVQVDPVDPINSQLIITFPPNTIIEGLTATSWCNVLLGIDLLADKLYMINLVDGTITFVCDLPDDLNRITSLLEHTPTANCENAVDLDCNNSSGATEPDFNSFPVNCLSAGAPVADTDVRLFYDAIIEEMTIRVTGFVPDAPDEILILSGATSNLIVSNSGTDAITLTNDGGATSADFINALQLIQYYNNAVSPTSGPRTVEVQFVTESGSTSNAAFAHILVEELPLAEVDLGPDLELCEGDPATLNAGNPGASYQWSTGAFTQTIQVSNPGVYSVTVTQSNHCPDQDTIVIEVIPNILIALTGDTEICNNENATLSVSIDSPIPVSIEITTSTGGSFTFTNVESDFNFMDMPAVLTTYTITNVVPSEPACLDMTDSVQTIIVYPTYTNDVFETICEGDSIWLGDYWETEAGEYEITFDSQHSCDSMVFFTIELLPTENIFIDAMTCDPSEAGVFITYLDNPTGCDTVVTTTISLLPSDTTYITRNTCHSDSAGVTITLLTNVAGCDSTVIQITSLTPPVDTTYLFQTSCDTTQLGTFYQIVTNQSGCDSLLITNVTKKPVDTTQVMLIACDTTTIGVFDTLLTNHEGCDSLVIITILPGFPDTTLLFTTSCDSASLGVFEETLISVSGCDSTIITSVTYSSSDSVFLTSGSCDPGMTGVFIQHLVNRFGCDSIVTETVTLLPSDSVFTHSSTCDAADAGEFIHTYVNQSGCDSLIIETVTYLPPDEILLSSTTCQVSDTGTFTQVYPNQYGCDSIVTEIITLVAADTTLIELQTCDPAQTGMISELYISQDGCDSLVIITTVLFPLPSVTALPTSSYNGFDISCANEADGSATADTTGIPPFSFHWSTGSQEHFITNLSAGSYQVTVTDGNGCSALDEIVLVSPAEFSIGLNISSPDCFGVQQGSITILPMGGVGPYLHSIDGIHFQTSPVFSGLEEGLYQLTSSDANHCMVTEIIIIHAPLITEVDLGADQSISDGDSALLLAIVNIPYDSLASIMWSGIDNLSCPECFSQWVSPVLTTSYSVSVTSNEGCTDRDSMNVFVIQGDGIYVPNIFSPNADQINDQLLISAGPEVEEIIFFSVFDRWGNMVFQASHFQPNDPTFAWDGTMYGQPLNSAVFAYRMVFKMKVPVTAQSIQAVRYGDITLLR